MKTDAAMWTAGAGLAGMAAGVAGGVLMQRKATRQYFETVEGEVSAALDDVRTYKSASKKLLDYYRQTNTDLASLAARVSKLLDLHEDAHPGASAHDPDWVARRVAEQVRLLERQGWQFDADPDDMSNEGWFTAISPTYEGAAEDG